MTDNDFTSNGSSTAHAHNHQLHMHTWSKSLAATAEQATKEKQKIQSRHENEGATLKRIKSSNIRRDQYRKATACPPHHQCLPTQQRN